MHYSMRNLSITKWILSSLKNLPFLLNMNFHALFLSIYNRLFLSPWNQIRSFTKKNFQWLCCSYWPQFMPDINPLNAKLNSICHLLALLGAHHILHVSRIRVNSKYHDLCT